MVLFLSNKRVNFMLFRADYYLRWWRLPIEERACRKTDLGGGDFEELHGLPPYQERDAGVGECKCVRKRGPGEGGRG